ncbi:Rqc2 family fibronectin-binding protein [Desulfotomaculum copahuensis]|uniref:Rqc2 homolog RqcH n=1 Tax=Desulfotomaculum copahuensis TaxID=1838280 RepID=A0A1B7LGC1_9FIRM|nr:NFACT RNA binding domain-containing protein [Desulfotomaculum copahuensis]OAT85017.1 hypothetical protein A6M21_07280 [Desulfotomaculum copahuensis]
MPFDGLVLAAVRRELEAALTGGRIDRIYQPDPYELAMIVHRPGGRLRLTLSAHPYHARVHLTARSRENPCAPPLFCMVLRKHLEGARIRQINQPGLDRVLTIRVEGRDELGELASRHLICEIMGRHSNIILVDPGSGLIIDAIKRYTHAVSRHREVLPGRPYVPPPEQHKQNPLTADEDAFRQIILEQPLETRLEDILQRRLDGISPPVAKEIVYRAGLPAGTILDRCGEHELRVLWQALEQIAVPAGRGVFQPALITDRKGDPVDFAAVDLTHYENMDHQSGTMNELVDAFFARRQEMDRREAQRQSLLSVVRRETGRLAKKLALQEESLSRAARAEDYRLYGELITANIYRLEKGDREAALENFYDSRARTVNILLDPRLTPAENAQAYFKKYNKARHTREAARDRAQDTKAELDYLQGVETAVLQAASAPELEEIRRELVDQDYIKPSPAARQQKKEREKPAPLAFTSSDGLTVLVGCNNRQNDYLTLRLAGGNDIWMHTKDIPGSHVIIRTEGKTVPERTLFEAASLAAYFSRARQSQNVPVDYTERKNVSKPKSARPGYVIYTGQRTITVDPDEELPGKLLRT